MTSTLVMETVQANQHSFEELSDLHFGKNNVATAIQRAIVRTGIPAEDIRVLPNKDASFDVKYKSIGFLRIFPSKEEYRKTISIESDRIFSSLQKATSTLVEVESQISRSGATKRLGERKRSISTRQRNLEKKLQVVDYLKGNGETIVNAAIQALEFYRYQPSKK